MLRIITRGFYGLMIAGLVSLHVQAASADVAGPDLLAAISQARKTLTNPVLLQTLDKIEADITAQDAAAATADASAASTTLTKDVLAKYVAVLQGAQGWITAQEAEEWSTYLSSRAGPLPPKSVEEQILDYDRITLLDKATQGINFASTHITDPLSRYRLHRLQTQMSALHTAGQLTMDNFYLFGVALCSLLPNPDLTGEQECQERYERLKPWFNGYDWLEDSLEAQTKDVKGPSRPYSYSPITYKDPMPIFVPTGFSFKTVDKSFLREDAYVHRPLIAIGFKGSVHGGSISGSLTKYLHDFTHTNEDTLARPILEFLLKPLLKVSPHLTGIEKRTIEYAVYHILRENYQVEIKTLLDTYPRPISQKVLGRLVIECLKRGSSAAGKYFAMTLHNFRISYGDETRSLHWVNSGTWPEGSDFTKDEHYAASTIPWHDQQMAITYDILIEIGSRIWSDETVPEELLATIRMTYCPCSDYALESYC